MGKFTNKEIDYLRLGGINNENWTESEKRGYLMSLSTAEKADLDMYDSKAKYCRSCVPSGKFISCKMTKKSKKCPNCGNIETV